MIDPVSEKVIVLFQNFSLNLTYIPDYISLLFPFQCSGPYCTAGSEDTLTQDFEIVSSVSFIDASNKANGEDAAKPQFTAKLPEDFFYPFT